MDYNFLGTSNLEREHFLLIYGENREAEELQEHIDENLDKTEISIHSVHYEDIEEKIAPLQKLIVVKKEANGELNTATNWLGFGLYGSY